MKKSIPRKTNHSSVGGSGKGVAAPQPVSVLPRVHPLTKIRYWLFLASLLTPLVYNQQSFFGFISERTWYINALIECMFLVAVYTPGFFSTKLSQLQVAILLLLTTLATADSFGVDPIQSFFSSYSRMEGFLVYLHLGLYVFALSRIPFPRPFWRTGLLLSVSVAVLVVLKGYFSASGWQPIDHRLIATVGNPSFLAGYLLLHLFVVLYLYTQFPALSRPIKQVMTGLVLLVLTGGMYLTGTRSAVIGLAAGCLYLAAFGLWRRYGFSSRSVGWLALLVVSFGSLFWIVQHTPLLQTFPFMYRLTHFTGDNNTFSPRFICWKMGLNGIVEHPLLGWGQENFSYGFAQQYDPAILLSSDYSWYDRAHNVLIDLGFSAGLLGLLAYAFLWVSLIHRLRSSDTLLSGLDRGILGAVFVAYFAFNLFNFDSLLPLQLFFLLLAFIDQSPAPSPEAFAKPVWVSISRAVAAVFIAGLAVYAVYQPYRTLRALDRQNKLTDIQERVRALETIYRQDTGHQLDMADNLTSLTLSVLQSEQTDTTKQFCYQRAITIMNEQLGKHPTYTRLMTRMVSLYTAGREIDKAIALCQQINTIEGSRRPPAFIQLGNAYLTKGSLPQAQAAFEQAHQLYPRWEEPMLYKALSCALQRDTAQCFRTLRAIDTRTLTNRLPFVKQIYGHAGDPRQFLKRLMQTERKELYPPGVFVEWALTAFDLNDTVQMTTAINSFYNMYFRGELDYRQFQKMIDEGKRGTRPDQLTTLANGLGQ